jgi:hypothetical protein
MWTALGAFMVRDVDATEAELRGTGSRRLPRLGGEGGNRGRREPIDG